MSKKLICVLTFVVILGVAVVAWAQSDAGFLDPPGVVGWACLHADGSFWAWTPFVDDDADACTAEWGPRGGLCNVHYRPIATRWCARNGYRF
jgi:hypothetical protein